MDLGFCLDLLGLRPTLILAVVLPLTSLMVLTVLISTAASAPVPLVPMMLGPPLIMASLEAATTRILRSVSATAAATTTTSLTLAGIGVHSASIFLAAT